VEHVIGDALEARYNEVRERMADAAARRGTDPGRLILVAVTKHAEPDQIRQLIELGHRDFGENRVQQLLQRSAMAEEMLARRRVLPRTLDRLRSAELELLPLMGPTGASGATATPSPPDSIRWHMIGVLQRNKAKKAAEVCRLIHSVDTTRLAEELQEIALKRDEVIEVLLQVNCSEEPQKHGFLPAAVRHVAEAIDTMVLVRIRGLMTMAPLSDNPDRDARPAFERCRELFEEIRAEGVSEGHFNILSMGMSGDYEVAIEEGANVVRVGTAIFGEAPA